MPDEDDLTEVTEVVEFLERLSREIRGLAEQESLLVRQRAAALIQVRVASLLARINR